MTASSTSPITSILVGKQCVGFVFARGAAGSEAFDERQSLGLFEDQDAAIAAIAAQTKQDAVAIAPPA
jgi:hypothetical protein